MKKREIKKLTSMTVFIFKGKSYLIKIVRRRPLFFPIIFGRVSKTPVPLYFFGDNKVRIFSSKNIEALGLPVRNGRLDLQTVWSS